MPTKQQVIEKYGPEMWDAAMCKTGWLDGITYTANPDGTIEIPESDIDRAYRSANGIRISTEEWD